MLRVRRGRRGWWTRRQRRIDRLCRSLGVGVRRDSGFRRRRSCWRSADTCVSDFHTVISKKCSANVVTMLITSPCSAGALSSGF